MKKLSILMVLAALILCPAMNAQLLKNLGNRAINSAKNKVENKVTQKVDDAVDDAMDDVLNGKKNKKNKNAESQESEQTYENQNVKNVDKKKAKGEEVKSDFVPGSVVIFEDDFAGEQMGEFPSKWDLLNNNAEVAVMNGKKAIKFEHGSDTEITPLIEDGNQKYLPEVYTLEFDFFITGEEDHNSAYSLWLKKADDQGISQIYLFTYNMGWDIAKPNTDSQIQGNYSLENIYNYNDWNHFALSFNKRALKVYINNQRVINIPNALAADYFTLSTEFWDDHITYITNVRLAKGAVALYDRNAQSMTAVEKAMAETGKFVTNNILFETGKATLKGESMDEIQKVADYMKKNPNVRFEVQGHTDNQGSDKINDPLSQQRAEAVVKALVGLGVDEWNLKPVGKGSHEPVADNKTDEGRAKNRRVEFIKK